MRDARIAVFARTPGVRYLWPNQDKVTIVVGGHIVSDESLSATVESQGQLVLAVVMPLEWDGGQTSIEERPGAFL